jgi:hypothetical protein
MNFRNIEIISVDEVSGNYIIKGDILDHNFNKIADFGPDGTDVFAWYVQQDEQFQLNVVQQFMTYIAAEIVAGTAE